MIVALMIGRIGSKGFPGKNMKLVLGKPLCEYPLIAAKKSKFVEKIFVSTDCSQISEISKKYKCVLLNRPKELATNEALGEDVYRYAYLQIKNILRKENKNIDLVVLLMANAATITSDLIDQGVKRLQSDSSFDSAVTTSIYNMYSPLRARKLEKDGSLKPFVPFESFGDPKKLNCDRDSQGNVYFADMSVSVVRPKCLEDTQNGLLPQKWMGKKIAPIFSEFGCDIDFEWQIPIVEHWLKKNKKNE